MRLFIAQVPFEHRDKQRKCDVQPVADAKRQANGALRACFLRAVIHAQMQRRSGNTEQVLEVRHHAPHRGARAAVGLRDVCGVRAAEDDEDFQRIDAKAPAGALRRLLERRERRRDEVLELLFRQLGERGLFLLL